MDKGICFAEWASGREICSKGSKRFDGCWQILLDGPQRERQQRWPGKDPQRQTETSRGQIRQLGCTTRAHNLLKSLQVGKKNLTFSKSEYSERHTCKWGKRTKKQKSPLADIYTKTGCELITKKGNSSDLEI